MQRPSTAPQIPSRQALAMAVEVLAGRMTRQRAIDQLVETIRRPTPTTRAS